MKSDLIKLERPISKSDQTLYCITEVANQLRLSKFTIRLFIARGQLPIIRLGRRVLIHKDDLNKFIEERRERCGPCNTNLTSNIE